MDDSLKAEGVEKLSNGPADWDFAHSELLEREGVDLKLEMEQKMREMEEQWRKEKEEATQAFQQERKKYEDQIESLQKQVICSFKTMEKNKVLYMSRLWSKIKYLSRLWRVIFVLSMQQSIMVV